VNWMWQLLNQIWATVQKIYALAIKTSRDDARALDVIQLKLGALEQQVSTVSSQVQQGFASDFILLKQILEALTPNAATGFTAAATPFEGDSMALKGKVKLAGDIQVADNGNGVLITINAVDSLGFPTAWPSAAPAPTVAEADPAGSSGPYFGTANAPTATSTGFTISVPLASPVPGLVTGVQFNVSVASGFPNQTAPETVQLEQAIDIVAGPAGSFVATPSAD